MNNLLERYIEDLERVDSVELFDNFILRLNETLQQEKADAEIVLNIRAKAKYFDNKFSNASTRESMIKAKESLMFYLRAVLNEKSITPQENNQSCLERYLKEFYLFLEAFKEIKPDKRATLTNETLQVIQVKNEYDLQHLLYAVLKPLHKDARKEVTEDSGIGAIRSDIKIASLNSIIEAKCTRRR